MTTFLRAAWLRYMFMVQYIPRNMHTIFALLCFVVVIHWLIFPYPSGLLHWHCGNLTIAPVPAKQPWWIWINTSCEFIMNDSITTTKQSTTKSCAYFLGYTVTCEMVYHRTIRADVYRENTTCSNDTSQTQLSEYGMYFNQPRNITIYMLTCTFFGHLQLWN